MSNNTTHPQACQHPSWEKAGNGKERCAVCGVIGEERRFFQPDGEPWRLASPAAGAAEPVAMVQVWNKGGSGEFVTATGIDKLPHGTLLYTHPAASTSAAQVLTREELNAILSQAHKEYASGVIDSLNEVVYERVQRAFAEKNGLRLADGEANHG